MMMATITGDVRDRQLAERRFYSRMALFMILLVFLGFAPSFYLRGIVPSYPRPNPTLSPSVIIHGLLFTTWMLVFVAQTQLVAAGRRDIHKKLGDASMVLALAIIPMMYLVGVWQVGRANQPPFTDPLNWSIVPLAGIPAYAFLVWTGWRNRRKAAVHKRAMLSAALSLMHPAIGRIPLGPPILPIFAMTALLSVATFIPLILWDRRTLGHVHPTTILGVSLNLAVVAVQLLFLATGTWAPIAAHLPGV
jgi:hypothetical protein